MGNHIFRTRAHVRATPLCGHPISYGEWGFFDARKFRVWKSISRRTQVLFSMKICSCICLLFSQSWDPVRAIKANDRKDGQFRSFSSRSWWSFTFLLLEGHGSRLQLPFLRYTNHPEHPYIVCLDLLNGTALWQVGDAVEQNGYWKMSITKFKRARV